ncbi:MAG TPA: NADPH-dependent F420 reductase [Thermoanaerobaculia bacterium]
MKIGILGAGNVGGVLGRGWAGAGHEIRFGVRDAGDAKVKALVAAITGNGGRAAAGSVAEAATFGDVVVLTTPWDATEAAIQSAGGLHGKIVLDCTNPLKPDLSGLVFGADGSAGEQVAAWCPGAAVVKIFNTTGANNMADPAYSDGKATMLYCGDDAAAKATAHQLAADLGFDPVDAGPLTQSRLLERFALLWISLAYQQKLGRDFAFRLMQR